VINQLEQINYVDDGDSIDCRDKTFKVIHTPGHSSGSINFYTQDMKKYKGKKYDGIIFTGDFISYYGFGKIFRSHGDKVLLKFSYQHKKLYNPLLSDNFLILPGHNREMTINNKRKNVLKKFCFDIITDSLALNLSTDGGYIKNE